MAQSVPISESVSCMCVKGLVGFMMSACLLMASQIIPAGLTVTNDCTDNTWCVVGGSGSGFGTTVYSVSITAEGNDLGIAPLEAGPGGSGSVTLNETGIVAGSGIGYIDFLGYAQTGEDYDVRGYATESFSVGDITGTLPGIYNGMPQPYPEELIPFELGVPFNIEAEVSDSVAPYYGTGISGYASAVLEFSFSIYGPQGYVGGPLIIDGPPPPPEQPVNVSVAQAPEPATIVLTGLGVVLMMIGTRNKRTPH